MNGRAQEVRVFIQARMSSQRFPGKVLAPLEGKPLIYHLVGVFSRVFPLTNITVLTSNHDSDDPLVAYLNTINISVFRGDLDNVFVRFRQCLEQFPCRYFLRSCADSPILSASLIKTMTGFALNKDADLITNVYPRTFPKGQSIEIVNAQSFAQIETQKLTLEQQEHITQFYYQNSYNFKILNLRSQNPEWSQLSLAVDTIEDLRRLEEQSFSELLADIALVTENQSGK